ncbi:hypothetical protein OJF2_39590 [Aquisphaera giovannonii]|uniref:DUF3352 domain-containing protein n=1 Tax=Aquisphaera giovannonii TaxID=406548 RepID=A0A5B9W551_9BACT|nr:hypothetical protein [Aquisphaera giovannonii]QEH35407.1 hypothetical protein OJF2_39590 [Aquisphaera giovannonii]
MRACTERPPVFPAALFLGLLCAALGAGRAQAQPPAGKLSRFIPAQGLSLYLEYDGLESHAGAWKATSAWQILNETPAGGLMADAARQTFDQLRRLHPDAPFGGDDVLAFQEHLTRRGLAIASLKAAGGNATVFVLPGMAGAPRADRVRRMLQIAAMPGRDKATSKPVRLRGRTLNGLEEGPGDGGPLARISPPPPLTWWMEGETLVLVKGPEGGTAAFGPDRPDVEEKARAAHADCVALVLDAIEDKAPNASTHPLFSAAIVEGRDIAGFEPNGLFAAESSRDAGVIGELLTGPGGEVSTNSVEYAISAAFGVTRARRVLARWGFRGKALLADLRFEGLGADAAKAGLLEPSGFRKDHLPPIPRRSGAFVIAAPRRQLDSKTTTDVLEGVSVREEYRGHWEAAKLVFEDAENRRAILGLFERLGPSWCLYAAPGGASGKETLAALQVDVKDVGDAEKALDALASRLNAYFREQELGEAGAGQEGRVPALVLERLPGSGRGYRLTSPNDRVPWLSGTMQPMILIAGSRMVLATNPEVARAALAAERRAEDRWQPSGETARLFECLPSNLSLLFVGNPRDSAWPEAIAELGGTTTPAIARLLGADLDDPPARPRPSELMSLLGIKPAGHDGKPLKAEDLRPLIFPSVFAVAIEARSVRILSLEALPFGCLGAEAVYNQQGLSKSVTLEPRFAPER